MIKIFTECKFFLHGRRKIFVKYHIEIMQNADSKTFRPLYIPCN